jgi:hypothetical protein
MLNLTVIMIASILFTKRIKWWSSLEAMYGKKPSLALVNFTRTHQDQPLSEALAIEFTPSIPRSIAIEIQTALLTIEPTIWPIQTALAYYSYWQVEHRLPTREEARDQMHRLLRLHQNPELYHEESKVKLSASIESVAKLGIGTGMCTFCLESQDNLPVQILNCGHMFHCGLEKWLSENVTCPICRSDVRSKK